MGEVELPREGERAPRAGSLSERLAASLRLGPVGLGCATTAVLVAVRALWEVATGHPDHLIEPGLDYGDHGVSLIIEVLIGFAVAMNLALRRANERAARELRPILRGSPAEHAALLERAARLDPSRAWLASLLAVPIGLLLVIDLESGRPYLLTGKPLVHSLVYGLLLNVVLFALIGRRAYASFDKWRVFSSLEGRVERIDLLDLDALAPLARRGLREAFFWLGGSSIASLLFVSVPVHWGTVVVMLTTVLVGTASFLLPMLGVHRRIRAAKQGELARVRDAIRRARDAGLDAGGAESDRAAARLPALLVWEARIERVREWPYDAPTLARFTFLVVLAMGSWLGGALVERVLNLFLG